MIPEYENIKFQIQNGVTTLTLNRPDKLNSFTVAMHRDVRDAEPGAGRQIGTRAVADRRRAQLLQPARICRTAQSNRARRASTWATRSRPITRRWC
ncbi:hypothetical protein LP420_25410 [Massilia sp. B-10]|nr:hypothetical protein LP420_25410 [Massilia sp. B-10]